MNVHKQSSLGLQVFKDEFRVVTSSGGGVGRHLLCRGVMNSINVLSHTSNTLSKYNIKKDPVSLSLAQFKIIQAPHWVPKMLHSRLKLLHYCASGTLS